MILIGISCKDLVKPKIIIHDVMQTFMKLYFSFRSHNTMEYTDIAQEQMMYIEHL